MRAGATGKRMPRSCSNCGFAAGSGILSKLRHAYEGTKLGDDGAKRTYELAIRLRHQLFERLHAPPTDQVSRRSLLLEQLLAYVAEVGAAEDRLVDLWTSFRAERLAFYRDSGTIPYDSWKSFYADLTARPGDPAGGRAPAPDANPGIVPAPPPPPGR